MRVLGFMSGTSLDGVDAALLDTDGERIEGFGPTTLIPFATEERAALLRATQDALRWNGDGETPPSFAAAEAVIHDVHVRAARAVLAQTGGALDLVGFHGQTVLHRPERALSVQIGDAQALANALDVPVVADMRQGDLAAGGQGAPLVPVYHAALAERIGATLPIAFLNVGGVANVSWLGPDDGMIAFDTGPGNGLIDLMVASRGAGRYDEDGALAAVGQCDDPIVQSLLALPYFRETGPKSLDRYDFPLEVVDHLGIEDAAATLTAFTAETVSLAAAALPSRPTIWIICGGGRHNPTMMQALRQRLGDCRSADEYGLRGDFIEAEAMAYLAARSVRGLPLTYPATTGVMQPTTGGRRWNPAGHADAPAPSGCM